MFSSWEADQQERAERRIAVIMAFVSTDGIGFYCPFGDRYYPRCKPDKDLSYKGRYLPLCDYDSEGACFQGILGNYRRAA